MPKMPKTYVLLLPMGEMGLFMVLYVLAAIIYPGGSWIVLRQNGFSFWNNYLCNFLDHDAINGELNSAWHFARASLGVLCLLVFLTNYYIYETGFFIESLPVIQKITFVLFISWFICLDVALYRKVMLSIKNVA